MDKNLNELLRWSIEAQTASGQNGAGAGSTGITTPDAPAPAAAAPNGTTTTAAATAAKSPLDPAVLAALLGGPSDADLMRQSMAAIASPALPLAERLVAFDNLEQLIESLDNANNLAPLGLWAPLLAQLASPEPDLRRYAAWCVGTAVQNNERSQAHLLDASGGEGGHASSSGSGSGLSSLVRLAASAAEPEAVRRKAVYALSSACRNYQPAMDAVAAELESQGVRVGGAKVDAADMDAVDEVMNQLKEKVKKDAGDASA